MNEVYKQKVNIIFTDLHIKSNLFRVIFRTEWFTKVKSATPMMEHIKYQKLS